MKCTILNVVLVGVAMVLICSPTDAMDTVEMDEEVSDTSLIVKIIGHGAPVLPVGFTTSAIVCADVVMILDISCSISRPAKQRVRNIAAAVAQSLLTLINPEDPSSFSQARVGVLTYSEDTRHVLYLNHTKPSKQAVKIIKNVKIVKNKETLCRTATHRALRDVRNYFFNTRQQNNKQVIHLYTDGLTFLRRNRKALYREQKKLKDMGVIINVIAVPQRIGKFEEEEYTTLPHTQQHLYNSTEPNIANQLIDGLINDASCEDIAKTS
ncbi:unnamed protein product [Owenia fusiformis]|uniref:Uncharacterized protein n=1 Tax=Owenia fusiformis TaxID=6347 RepID=A0A8J1TL70_OWEFU|nr:unnamed protein product [Owenia fusiformis]